MELENLRTIWRVTMERPAAREQTSEDIRALLGRRSQGLVAKMKRNLFGELILVLGIYTPAILFYLFEFGGKLSEMGWALLLMIAFFTVYYYRKNKLLNEMQCLSCRVRSNLERQVNTLKKYVRFYTIAGTILVPVMAVLSFLITARNLSLSSSGSSSYSLGSNALTGAYGWKGLGIGAMALVSVTLVSYYANGWYMNKLYGRHIRKLRGLLQEMNEE